mmetsp:Transcript_15930/g.24613  ORF Transcript_15930/g.24613 Transcript_15930/m.24613 type:complete len:156 (-) Transcript_15930:104-571(-)
MQHIRNSVKDASPSSPSFRKKVAFLTKRTAKATEEDRRREAHLDVASTLGNQLNTDITNFDMRETTLDRLPEEPASHILATFQSKLRQSTILPKNLSPILRQSYQDKRHAPYRQQLEKFITTKQTPVDSPSLLPVALADCATGGNVAGRNRQFPF